MHQDVDTTAIRAVLDRHGVPKHHHGDFEYLIDTGLIDNPLFQEYLHTIPHYMAACEELMELLSLPFYQLRPKGPPLFTSLTSGDVPPLSETLYDES